MFSARLSQLEVPMHEKVWHVPIVVSRNGTIKFHRPLQRLRTLTKLARNWLEIYVCMWTFKIYSAFYESNEGTEKHKRWVAPHPFLIHGHTASGDDVGRCSMTDQSFKNVEVCFLLVRCSGNCLHSWRIPDDNVSIGTNCYPSLNHTRSIYLSIYSFIWTFITRKLPNHVF